MHIDLTGKNVLITGGTRGIGRVISHTLTKCGARIGAIYRSDSQTAEATLTELRNINDVNHFILQADIANEHAVEAAVQSAQAQFGGKIDILILDAAQVVYGEFIATSTADWMRSFDTNVHGAFFVVRAAAPYLQRGGSVIFLSSGAGHDPMAELSAYGASKAAANHLSTVLAQELGPKGIRVNTVSPGHTDKSGNDPNADPQNYTEKQKTIIETTALRRFGVAQDVANVVLFFASDLSGFVTGQWVRVNGGRL